MTSSISSSTLASVTDATSQSQTSGIALSSNNSNAVQVDVVASQTLAQ